MKLYFSLAAKSTSKFLLTADTTSDATSDATESADAVEFVTEFDATKTLADPERPKIARLRNKYHPYKRMKNLDAAIREPGPTGPQFEVVSASGADDLAGTDISYGNSNTTRVSADDVMLQKLKQDLKDLPDGPDMNEYKDMPVEEFARALLAGYGWQEGKGIGRNAKEDVKIVQYKRRTGLGFNA